MTQATFPSVSKKFKQPVYVIDDSTKTIHDTSEVFAIDGYDFGDTLLEGVFFYAKLSEDRKTLTVFDTNSPEYMEGLNSTKWAKTALKCFQSFAEEGESVWLKSGDLMSTDCGIFTEELATSTYPELFIIEPTPKKKPSA